MSTPSTPQQVVALIVHRILAATPTGSAIFSGRTHDDAPVRVIARPQVLPRLPRQGEHWEITGYQEIHPTYGPQLQASRCVQRVPTGRLLAQYLVRHPALVGLGKAKVRRLQHTFGAELVPLLNRADAATLGTVLSEELAQRLVTVWAEQRAEAEVVAFLDAHRLDVRLANRLRDVWGQHAIAMVMENPYYLLAFARWRMVDAAARQLGVCRHDPRRLVGAVESALYDRLDAAHTLTKRRMLAALVGQRLQTFDVNQAIALAVREQAVVGNAIAGYQPIGVAAMETAVATRLRTMLEVPRPLPSSAFLLHSVTPEWLRRCIAEFEAQQPFPFNEAQRAAIVMALTEPVGLLLGGAGVGKTTALKAIINLAHRIDLTVWQMALSGRAAKRMAQASGQPAMTIAKFLLAVKKAELTVYPDSLVVIDEASMLDLATMHRILRVLPTGVRMLLVGDPAQLPPIGFGLVFHQLARSPEVPRTELVEVHRQAASTGIPAVASAIRQHTLPALAAFAGARAGVHLHECSEAEMVSALFAITDCWTEDDWQIIAATNDVIRRINLAYHLRRPNRVRLPGRSFAVGDPVIHVTNDYHRGLMNGTLGRIVEVRCGANEGLLIDFEGEPHFFETHLLYGRVELAYAISCHKAQGSQFQRVLVVVSPSRLMDHSWVYTALTRGQQQVVFVGSGELLGNAVRQPALAMQRQVAFFKK